MKVPTKVTVSGDVEKGKSYIGLAQSQMNILENQMQFQGLKQSSRTVKYSNGLVIECWSCFSLRQVTVFYPGGERFQEEKGKLCFCNCHMSVGQVRYQPNHNAYSHMIPTTLYDVLLCYNKERFTFLKNIPSAGFHKYLSGPLIIDPITNKRSFGWGEPVLLLADFEKVDGAYQEAQVGCGLVKCRIIPVFIQDHEISTLPTAPPTRK